MRRLRYSTTFMPLCSVATSLSTPLEWMDSRMGKGSKALPTVWKVELADLGKLNIRKSMGPDEINSRVLRADLVAKPLSMTFEKS